MPSQNSIDVRIIVDGKPLIEYLEPNADDEDYRLCTRYVEVVAGQKFGIRIKLLQGYDLRFTKYIEAKLQLDNHEDATQYCTVETWDMEHHRGRLLQEAMIDENWNGRTMWDEGQGQWMEVEYEFGALGTSKSISHSHFIITITITI